MFKIIPAGTKVLVKEISTESVHYRSKNRYENQTGIVTEDLLMTDIYGGDWYSGEINFGYRNFVDSDLIAYIYGVRVEICGSSEVVEKEEKS